jgi:membrane fusion protein (multidrug efflux system)
MRGGAEPDPGDSDGSHAVTGRTTKNRFLIALLAIAPLAGCSERAPESASVSSAATLRDSLPRIQIAPVSAGGGGERTVRTYLEAEREAELVAETDGDVKEIRVREGRRVQAGDTLLIIDDRDERLAVQRDQAEYVLASAQFGRVQALEMDGHVSTQEVDQSRAQLERAEANLGLSRVALSRCEVRAPISGLVWMLRVEPLHRVTVGQPLLRVTDPDRLRASAYLPAALHSSVRVGTRVRLEPAAGGQPIDAVVSRVDPLTDPASGTFKAVATFRWHRSDPAAGSEMRFVVPGSPRDDANCLLPLTTLIEGEGDSTWVWQYDGARVHRQLVRLGAVQRDGIQVDAGLAGGARVVVGSDRPLQDGAAAEVVQAP